MIPSFYIGEIFLVVNFVSTNNNETVENIKEKGNHFFKKGQYSEAIQCYSRAIEIDKNYLPAWNNLLLALKKAGRDEEYRKGLDLYKKIRDGKTSLTQQKIPEKHEEKLESTPFNFFSVFNNIISSILGKKETKKNEMLNRKNQEQVIPHDVKISPVQEQPFLKSADFPDKIQYDVKIEPLIFRDTRIQKSDQDKSNEMVFIDVGETLRVDFYTIKDPMVYIRNYHREDDDASCISLDLPIGKEVIENSHSLPYYPKYSQISPDQRANYLSWLSGGRCGDLPSIGYVFLYFYGLEKRALLEKKDIIRIIDEIRRLLETYSFSASFNSYLHNFLAFTIASHIDEINEEEFLKILPIFDEVTDGELQVILAWFAQNQKPIPSDVAFLVCKKLSDIPYNTALKRIENELKILFEKRFRQKYPHNFPFEISKKPYKLEYQPASPSLLRYSLHYGSNPQYIAPILVPSVLGKPSQFSTLISEYESCIEELKPFSKKFQKSKGVFTDETYSALPDELKERIPHPRKNNWIELFNSFQIDDLAVIPVSKLCDLLNIPKRTSLTPSQCKNFVQVSTDIGYQIIPDYKITGLPYRWDDYIALLPISEKKGKTSKDFDIIALIYDLSLSIINSDGTVTEDELNHLKEEITEKRFKINEFERDCLNALKKLRLLKPYSSEKYARRLKERLSVEQRLKIAQLLIDLAIIDKILTKDEQKTLKRVFSLMDIDEISSDKLIADVLFTHHQEIPITIQKKGEIQTGEIIPPFEEKIQGIKIDWQKTQKILDNQKEVVRLCRIPQ